VGIEEPREVGGGIARDGSQIADSSIPKLLSLLSSGRQVNRKTLEGSHNPDRNAQFEHINAAVTATQAVGQPVISIDTKKKDCSAPIRTAAAITVGQAVPTRSMCMISCNCPGYAAGSTCSEL
jgi:hypothetical protein